MRGLRLLSPALTLCSPLRLRGDVVLVAPAWPASCTPPHARSLYPLCSPCRYILLHDQSPLPPPKRRTVKVKKRTLKKKATSGTKTASTISASSAHVERVTFDGCDETQHDTRASDGETVMAAEVSSSPVPFTHVMPFVPVPCVNAPLTASTRPVLPPWPVDSIEFNACVKFGGHDQRLAAERRAQQEEEEESRRRDPTLLASSSASYITDSHSATPCVAVPPVSPPPANAMPTAAQHQHLEAAQQSAAGQAALSVGGWVCAGCFTPIPLASRSVCGRCFTLRHDLAFRGAASSGRADPRNWRCRGCDEFNFASDHVCRCCQTPRATTTHAAPGSALAGSDGGGGGVRRVGRRTVADELQTAPLGSVLDVRGRVLRWRCAACSSVNSLQARLCRHCRGERFAIALRCSCCPGVTHVDNATVYGESHAEASDPERRFHLNNRYSAHAPQLCCTHCRSSLHGATVLTHTALSDHLHMWWCACGMTNKDTRHSCMRCRLPRLVPPTVLTQLMPSLFSDTAVPSPQEKSRGAGADVGHGARGVSGERGIEGGWDFADCTHWYCQSCDGINKASRYVVYAIQDRPGDSTASHTAASAHSPDGTASRRVARMYHGHSRCQHCQAPWHHLVLPSHTHWRCACLQINTVAVANTTSSNNNNSGGGGEVAAPTVNDACLCCGLPPLDRLKPDLLSMWTPGDWCCVQCGRHCYRERMRCVCGATRPGTVSAQE